MMHDGFSTVDGFMEVNESVAEMIRYLANEPSVGLFFVQQHTHNAVPNLINVKDNIVEKSYEITLQTEDFEDSISMVNSMKECGFSIADEMNKDIRKSLLIMSTLETKKWVVQRPGLGSQISRSSSWSPSGSSYGRGHAQAESSSGYLSTVFNSAKQRASALRWPQLDASQFRNSLGKSIVSTTPPPESVMAAAAAVSDLSVTEVDELPLSSQIGDKQLHVSTTGTQTLPTDDFCVIGEF